MKKKRKVKRKSQKKQVKKGISLTAPVNQKLSELGQQLGNIFPASSYYDGALTFSGLAKKYKLGKYWPKTGNKNQKFFEFLKKVYKNHKRTLIKILRENLHSGIERRHKQGEPVLKSEINNLDATLRALSINLTKEIKALETPEIRPRIVPPTPAFIRILNSIGLHSQISEKCSQLFIDGHINESARKALEIYEKYIQENSSPGDRIGKELMSYALNTSSPKIIISDLSTDRGKAIQEGIMHLSMGAMQFWRNYFSHGDEEEISHFDCLTILCCVSHLFHYININKQSC